MGRIILALLLVCGAVLSFAFYSRSVSLEHEELQVKELTVKLKSKSVRENVELQEKCAKQALEVYTREQGNSGGRASEIVSEFTNHYNTKLNRCFVEIHVMHSKPISESTTVIDAFESKPIADYLFVHPKNNKQYWNTKPVLCDVLSLSGETKYCGSSEEFDTLIKPYME